MRSSNLSFMLSFAIAAVFCVCGVCIGSVALAHPGCEDALQIKGSPSKGSQSQIWANREKTLQQLYSSRNVYPDGDVALGIAPTRSLFDPKSLPNQVIGDRLGPILQIQPDLHVWDTNSKKPVHFTELVGQHMIVVGMVGSEMMPPVVGQIVAIARGEANQPSRLIVSPSPIGRGNELQIVLLDSPYAMQNTRPGLFDHDKNYVGHKVDVYLNSSRETDGNGRSAKKWVRIRTGPVTGRVLEQNGFRLKLLLPDGKTVTLYGLSTMTDWIEVNVHPK